MAKIKLDKIYKKASTGKTVEWEIEISGNKYRTITGQQGGKKVTSKWTVCEGKNIGRANETSGEEQAMKEAQAARRKKLEKDYKTYESEISDVGYFKPMLAKEYKKFEAGFAQPKLDGIRCIITKNSIKSRNGKDFYAVPHIRVALDPVFQKYPDLTFDGELYNHELRNDFDSISSIVRKQKVSEADLERSEKVMQYWIYDLYDSKLTFGDRFKMLTQTFKEFKLKPPLVLVPTSEVTTEQEVEETFESYVENGYEGLILRLDAPYENKRSKNLLKYKKFVTDEFIIADIVEGTGNRTGTVGYIVSTAKNGKSFRSNVKGSFEYLEKVWKNRKALIGKEVTIKYFKLTPQGVPKFAYVVEIDRKSYE